MSSTRAPTRALLVTLLLLAGVANADSPWPMRQGSWMGTGQSSAGGPTSSGKTLRCSGVPSTASPAISEDGAIFQPSTGGVLFAINGSLTSGALLWKFSPLGSLSPSAACLTPVISEDGTMVFYAADNLYALNITTGDVLWSWNASLTPGATFLTVLRSTGDGRVYALVTGPAQGTQGVSFAALAALAALDGATGNIQWQRLGLLSDFSISADGATLFAVSSSYTTSNPSNPSAPTTYISSSLYRIDSATGNLLASQVLAPPGSTQGTSINAAAAPLVTSDGKLVLITSVGPPYASSFNMSLWNPATSSQSWFAVLTTLTTSASCPQGAQVFSLPTTVMDSTLLISWSCQSAAGMLGLSLLNGAQVFIMSLPSFSATPPNADLPPPIAGADSTSYTSSGGSVYGVNSGSGALLWAVNGTATAQVPYSAIGTNKVLVVGNCLYVEAM